MKESFSKLYNEKFYNNHTDKSYNSASIILDELFKVYAPESVLDLGCGRGAWLAAAEAKGCSVLVGYDGNWINEQELLSKNIKFNPINLENSFQIDGHYDLVISVEVAEHISKDKAENFIKNLCNAADVIVFSAAIKGQGGTNHINEQPQSFWIKLFDKFDFEVVDFFRAKVWNNEQVEYWYKQNVFLFLNENGKKKISYKKTNTQETSIYDIVHPELLAAKIKHIDKLQTKLKTKSDHPSFDYCRTILKNYLKNKIT